MRAIFYYAFAQEPGAHYRAHTGPLYHQLNVLLLQNLIDLKVGIFMFKFKNSLLPSILSNYFVTQSQVHSQNTKNCSHYRLPIFRSALAQRQSIQYNGVKIWNNLSAHLNESKTLTQFKKRYKLVLSGLCS